MSAERPTCWACGKPLRLYPYRNEPGLNDGGRRQFGTFGDNYFCGKTCGYEYAVRVVQRHDAADRTVKS